MFPKTASAQQIQRNYRSIFDEVMKDKKPFIILNNNKPEVVIIDVGQFKIMQDKAEQFELEMAKKAIEIGHKEQKDKKLKKLRSLSDLI
jgi:prevent-host-death family protein